MKIGKMQKSKEAACKNDRFRHSNYQNWVIFRDIFLTFCTHTYISNRVRSHTFRFFWKFESLIWKFLKIAFFVDYFSNFKKNSQPWKYERAVWHTSSFLIFLLKTNRFYLWRCLRDRVSCDPLFLPKTGKTWPPLWRYLWLTHQS